MDLADAGLDVDLSIKPSRCGTSGGPAALTGQFGGDPAIDIIPAELVHFPPLSHLPLPSGNTRVYSVSSYKDYGPAQMRLPNRFGGSTS